MASFSGFGTFRKPTAAYQQIGLSSDVTTADPHRLILLLFEGADAALNTASFCMKEGNIPGKGQAISKAISIINDGRACYWSDQPITDETSAPDVVITLEVLDEHDDGIVLAQAQLTLTPAGTGWMLKDNALE